MMMRFPALFLAILSLAACHPRAHESGVDLRIDMDTAASRATLTCTASSTGSCVVAYIDARGDATMAEAKVGGSTVTAVTLPATYCAGAETPDPSGCRAQPLAAGQQIVRLHRTHTP
jgi:hypothetical protein